ncbi:hypothetical protein JCM10212_003950 [Sporobolomyces blumeae]
MPLTMRRPPTKSSGYGTLALHRPTLPPRLAPRPGLHPSLFLFHVTSISFATCLIPAVGARQSSSRAGTVEMDETSDLGGGGQGGPPRTEYPIQQPYPTQQQLLRLSSQLRRQIRASPFDAAFTLRQLHLVNELPRLHLPDSPGTDLSTLLPERWIWRLPATAALHSIFRLLRDPRTSADPRITETLLPIAFVIARHALEFDTVMWVTVLKAQGQANAIEWERLLLRARGQAGGEGLDEDPTIMTRLNTSERDRRVQEEDESAAMGERSYEAFVKSLWGDGVVHEAEQADASAPLSSRIRAHRASTSHPGQVVDVDEVRPLPSHLRSFSSIPVRTLDRFVAFVRANYAHDIRTTSSNLSISLALSNLRVSRSRRAVYDSFDSALRNGREDLAARFWVDYVETVQRRRKGWAPAVAMLQQKLAPVLRPTDKAFDPEPRRETLAAVAALARALDEQWSRTLDGSATSTFRPIALSELLRLVASFPVAPYAHDLEAGTDEHRLARQHARVYRMVKHVLRRIVEDTVERTVHLTSAGSTLGMPWRRRRADSFKLPLTPVDFNTLISWTLNKFQSPELALLLVERLTRQGFSPTAATHNILFSVIAGDGPKYERILESTSSVTADDRTIPTLVTHMTKTSTFDELERIVFRILPELDQGSLAPSLNPPTPITPSPPPKSGRSPYLYTTLLHALACAGRVGLAERVFRNARWAAERSREEDDRAVEDETRTRPRRFKDEPRDAEKASTRRKGWVLPPHAFTIMLQLYAAEVKRGRELERQLDPSSRRTALPSSPVPTANEPNEPPLGSAPSARRRVNVRGWGRHALRVFLLRSAREQVDSLVAPDQSGLDSTSLIARDRPHRFSKLPPFLRSEAAPIVALYELEGGSKPEELRSLEVAMNDERTKEALETLFPGMRARGEGTREHRPRTRRQKKDVRAERKAVRREKDKIRAEEIRLIEEHRRSQGW